MKTAARTAGLVIVCLSWAFPASSDPILIDGRRFVNATGSFVSGEDRVFFSSELVPETPFGSWDGGLSLAVFAAGGRGTSTATQRSVITPTRISASGRLDSEAVPGGVIIGSEAQSGVNVTFDLTVPHRYSFHAAVQRDVFDPQGFSEFAIAVAGIALTGVGELNRVGILPVGRHEFLVEALTFAEATPEGGVSRRAATYEADLHLTPVPEPGTMVLVGAGSLFVARWRRKLAR